MAETIYQRWVDLAAHLLVDDGDDPLTAVAGELAQDFHATATVLRTGAEGDVAALVADERDAGRGSALVLPFAGATGPPWVVLTRRQMMTAAEQDEAVRVHRLAVGLVQHVPGPDPGGRRPGEGETAAPSASPAGASSRASSDAIADDDDAAGPAALTERERDVLRLMAEGLIAQAIGHRLGVSARTVAKHQERIYRKLDTCDRLTTVLRAQEVGLVTAQVGPSAPGPAPTSTRASARSAAASRAAVVRAVPHGGRDASERVKSGAIPAAWG